MSRDYQKKRAEIFWLPQLTLIASAGGKHSFSPIYSYTIPNHPFEYGLIMCIFSIHYGRGPVFRSGHNGFPPGRIKQHSVLSKRELLDTTRAGASLLYGGRWLTETGLETPAPNVANVARRASPAPVTSARLHGEAARQGRRRRGRRGCAGGKVVLEEAEDDDDVPVTVQDADEEAEVNDLP